MNTTPIRVLHVLGGLEAGGAESFVMNLYRAVDKGKIQFDFVKHIEHKGVFENEITQMGGKIYRCPQYNGKNHIVYCRWWNSFFEEHQEYRVVHGHVRSTAAIYLKIAKKNDLVTIAHSHSTSNGNGISALVKDMMQLPIRYTADFLFACSDKAGKWLYGENATRKPNYRMIPNGVDLRRFAFHEKKRKEMRNELGIAEDTFVLGHVGRIIVPKNHKFLVELFADYHGVNPNSKLLLIGNGELFETVQQQCTQLGIREAVIMVGSKTNTEDYYQAMDVFVFPSLWEGLGIVAIEAQANGLTCLVSENVPEEAILTENTNALSLQSKDAWLDGLQKVSVGERMRTPKNCMQQYDICTIADYLQRFYLEQHEKVRR
ncbi:MAG: glycosyltransferase family 1 protein [Eubacteriales bacterium]|nr:glycosyltransferase family 1 protein [Eubacteriales bacterium]